MRVVWPQAAEPSVGGGFPVSAVEGLLTAVTRIEYN